MSTINIDSKGYGKIHKSVMRNRQLPLLAKTIYICFRGYAGNNAMQKAASNRRLLRIPPQLELPVYNSRCAVLFSIPV